MDGCGGKNHSQSPKTNPQIPSSGAFTQFGLHPKTQPSAPVQRPAAQSCLLNSAGTSNRTHHLRTRTREETAFLSAASSAPVVTTSIAAGTAIPFGRSAIFLRKIAPIRDKGGTGIPKGVGEPWFLYPF